MTITNNLPTVRQILRVTYLFLQCIITMTAIIATKRAPAATPIMSCKLSLPLTAALSETVEKMSFVICGRNVMTVFSVVES